MEKKSQKQLSLDTSYDDYNLREDEEYSDDDRGKSKKLDFRSKQTKKLEKQLIKLDKVQNSQQPVSMEIYYLLKFQQNLIYQVTSLHTRIMRIIENQFDYSTLL
ncbi:unnamed protein product (macronuclear) [Paramecium tetraurelia]|uniref:Uncharacterized protein n=1 Tax=Paramecium tetraurelia TaxID=5888 RepID=A0DTU0_PARTE|nr:uncharacterized protein GSPATT00020139001 [Paramecium tetraurelia]CAK86457.1 unnamed protein product [Paramecium tetraurelia]|eukprot:XP_001453854.1 hypothetical protein (macronuclear) [Paramecium tetraurelia strain d4-2]